tara:strand:- start:1992 stop:2213 length:222 start_codon:yes stop_codon:yes gene_type:complete
MSEVKVTERISGICNHVEASIRRAVTDALYRQKATLEETRRVQEALEYGKVAKAEIDMGFQIHREFAQYQEGK